MKELFSDIEQQSVQDCDPWEKRNKWSEVYDNPWILPEGAFHTMVWYMETPEKQSGLPELKRKTLDSRELRSLEFARQSSGKEGATQKKSSRNLYTDPLD